MKCSSWIRNVLDASFRRWLCHCDAVAREVYFLEEKWHRSKLQQGRRISSSMVSYLGFSSWLPRIVSAKGRYIGLHQGFAAVEHCRDYYNPLYILECHCRWEQRIRLPVTKNYSFSHLFPFESCIHATGPFAVGDPLEPVWSAVHLVWLRAWQILRKQGSNWSPRRSPIFNFNTSRTSPQACLSLKAFCISAAQLLSGTKKDGVTSCSSDVDNVGR